MVRAKFKVDEITFFASGVGKLVLQPVTGGSEENEKFFKYTPGGKIELHVVAPETLKMFEVGVEYYIDFTPATEAVAISE